MVSDWISCTEASELMNVSSRTVRNYIAMRLISSKRYVGKFLVSRAEVMALARIEDPLAKARSLVEVAKTYATSAKFPPGKFNELLQALEKPEKSEKREPKRSAATQADIDSILG